jgi:protein-tyrosine sulfotransferase
LTSVAEVSPASDTERPVFVLTMARSGSTLLRFILDSHPDLACPPETNVGPTCFGLARLWDTLDPSPESAAREFASPEPCLDLSAEAAASIRGVVDAVYGRYVAHHGKRRWCDKSLDSTRMADLLAELYPQAQFVCLYRHCLDVVVSAIEATPWGLNGYGFDSYVAGTPGNSVLAAARCWLDQTSAIIDFQDKHPDRCHGIRYEDMVTRPEEIAGDLFSFLGVDAAPGVTETCLTKARDSRGPGDHKIWFTNRISADSLGQGTKIPALMLPPEFLAKLNETLEQLDYRPVDDAWWACDGPIDPRADVTPVPSPGGPPEADGEVAHVAAEISGRLDHVPAEQARELAERWPDAAKRGLCLMVEPPAPAQGGGRRWILTWPDGALAIGEDEHPPEGTRVLAATARTWAALLGGAANLAAEQRAGRLRLLDPAADPHSHALPAAPLHLLAHLLGLSGPGTTDRIKSAKPEGR